jgi:hypothetical protein
MDHRRLRRGGRAHHAAGHPQYYHLEEIWGDKPVRLKFGSAKPAVFATKPKRRRRQEGAGEDQPAPQQRRQDRHRAPRRPPRKRKPPRKARRPGRPRRARPGKLRPRRPLRQGRGRRPSPAAAGKAAGKAPAGPARRPQRRPPPRPRPARHEAARGRSGAARARLGGHGLGRLRQALPARDAARAQGRQDRAARLAHARPVDGRRARAHRGAIPRGARIVALDERGTALTTVALAAKLKAWQLGCHRRRAGDRRTRRPRPGLPRGGPRARAPVRPHVAARHGARAAGEQLYRAWSINANHPYHRE